MPDIIRMITDNLPPRVAAAMHWISLMQNKERGGFDSCGGTELTPKEVAVSDAAIEVTRLYLSGEMDYGDVPPKRESKDEGDAGEPALVKV